jgi:hypothetical protein
MRWECTRRGADLGPSPVAHAFRRALTSGEPNAALAQGYPDG